jgi:hypothetical protein
MNVHDRALDGPAVLRYGTPEYEVIRPGRYVLCAVSGKRIPLEALRYWSPELQEAYAGPDEMTARWKALHEQR